MSITTSEMTPADIAAVTNNGGFGNGNEWWIILFLLFGWGRGGWGGYGSEGGASRNYVLASDFATIQRQLSDGFATVEKGTDTIRNGLCDGFYTEAQLINGVNTNIMQGNNALQAQLAQCCCDNKAAIADVKYAMAQDTCAINNAIQTGFCQTNFNLQTMTRDITDNANANTKAILDFLVNDKMSNLQRENDALRLSASQARQNNYLISQLRPSPVPAYQVANPNCCYTACGCAG